ncbi:hypothetical protein KN248_012990 [Mycobacterium paraintracellulare]|uniref:hypothetical protein n=1 Tax=Mycobacterium paraintracellulare TaxID=1138383 RepID=UPI001EED7CE8|nr:hypothetical protein [Mycobacterium paraintracellulare]WVL46269.1 hypothetical protein KN248_012990 [Mycobacterium paraintracellulare]
MTLVEFIHSVRSGSRRIQVLSVLYWYAQYREKEALSASEIRAGLQQARIPKAKDVNVPDVLARAGAYVDSVDNNEKGHKLWQLTDTGKREVRSALGLPGEQPEIAHSTNELQKLAAKLSDAVIREYIEEAILCLSVGALRAAIVFMWVAAARELQNRIWTHGATAVNAAVQTHNSKARQLKKFDDLSEIKETLILQVAQDLGEIDKSEKQMLDQCLTTRNQCGHPNKYRPGAAKAKAHIEEITSILFI